MPKVSIIIPTYNSERFIDRTIQSVINQTYKDWELILADDVSKDNTRKKLEEWQKKDNRIKLVFLDKNSGGPAHPKNVAIKEAVGKYIAYLDHDDKWLPEKLEKQISILEKDQSIGLISCEAEFVDKDGKHISNTNTSPVPEKDVFPEILYKDFFTSNSSLIIPKAVIDKLGERDENPQIGPSEDREYELHIAAAGYKFYVLHEVLFKYYIHDNNTSNNQAKNAYWAEASLKYLEYYKKYNLEYILYERFIREYLRIGDIENTKKYCKLYLSKRPFNIKFVLIYIFLIISGKGVFISIKHLILSTRNNMLYLIGKKSKFERDQYAAGLKLKNK